MQKEKLNINNYTYDLPDCKIAKYPIAKRDESKLLLYQKGTISEEIFKHVSQFIPNKSLLLFNNTKVIQARLNFKKETGSNIEIFCLEPIEPFDYQLVFSQTNTCTWKCMVGNLKKWKAEHITNSFMIDNQKVTLTANKIGREGNAVIITFKWDRKISFGLLLEVIGNTPIPPYLKRKSEQIDQTRYQTVYSKNDGSVAAPTAGLHFTEEALKKIEREGHQLAEVTLHVGAGTFQPVAAEDPRFHPMHSEFFTIDIQTLKVIQQYTGDIIPVGTTSLRCLESIYWLGCTIIKTGSPANIPQFIYEEYEFDIPAKDSISSLIDYIIKNELEEISCSTRIMILPGYRFQMIKGIFTNFHQPKSTLLLLIAALIGEDWKDVYQYAFENDFRFLSYGDSSLLLL